MTRYVSRYAILGRCSNTKGATMTDQERQTGPEARARRYREKMAAGGIKQVNIQLPEQHIDNIKRIATRLRDGQSLREACAAELPQQPTRPPTDRQTTERELIMRGAGRASGWRLLLLRWLLLR